ncbi:MAG: ABC transporter substrate-binding protein [Anaerolineae bacterium]|nr:ABC transporter substrate-binding protein [Anaerolineae bacterium]
MLLCLASLILLLASACGSERTIAEERAYRAAHSQGDILIGVAADPNGWMWKGIQMAVEEINGAGGILGRQVQVVQAYDESSATRAKLVAQQFASNPDIVAVIGHWGSDMAIAASATYEFAGLLMLCPAATSPKLTQQGFKLVFRISPSNEQVGPQLARFAASQGYKRMMIVSAKDAYGRGLGNVFEMQAGKVGITIVDRVSYADGETDLGQFLGHWNELDFDAIFVAGTIPEVAYLVQQARAMGITQPILGGEGLATDDLMKIAGEAAEGTLATTYFHPDDPRPEVQRFRASFEARYGVTPEVWAAQGYDAVYLLAYAMETAGSTVPTEVADALRRVRGWPGVTGPHSFQENGDVVDKPIVLITVRNDAFEYYSGLGE